MTGERRVGSRTPPTGAVRAAEAVRRGLQRAHDVSTPPAVRIYEQLGGVAELVLTGVIAEAGIPDLLADGPRTVDELAEDAKVDRDALARTLRFLAGRGVVSRHGERYGLTGVSELLRSDHPDSLRAWARFAASGDVLEAWGEASAVLHGDVPFRVAHNLTFFETMERDEAAATRFDGAMRAGARLTAQLLLDVLDLTGVDSVCDVGGGTGTLLAALLQANPHLRGTLVDLDGPIARSQGVLEGAGVADRVVTLAASFFESVPPDHDRYLLSSVLHDWADDDAVRVLERVREAMRADARAVVVEFVLPRHAGDSLVNAVDTLMLVLAEGRERTDAELDALFTRAGLHRTRTTPLVSGAAVIELARADA